jgi:hypothetical protein
MIHAIDALISSKPGPRFSSFHWRPCFLVLPCSKHRPTQERQKELVSKEVWELRLKVAVKELPEPRGLRFHKNDVPMRADFGWKLWYYSFPQIWGLLLPSVPVP